MTESASQKYKNLPIVEALLDIQVDLPHSVDLELLATYHEKIKDRFPEKQNRIFWEGKIEFGKETPLPAQPKSTIIGYLFRSPSENKVIQARRDGFSFSKLKPYEDGDKFLEEAKKLWVEYVEISKPIRIKRVALRYINRIEIPGPTAELSDYIVTRPEIASGITSKISNYLMQIVLNDSQFDATAIITHILEQAKEQRKNLPIIFDIDVSRLVNLNIEDKELWKTVDTLRAFKNMLFDKSITKKTWDLFI